MLYEIYIFNTNLRQTLLRRIGVGRFLEYLMAWSMARTFNLLYFIYILRWDTVECTCSGIYWVVRKVILFFQKNEKGDLFVYEIRVVNNAFFFYALSFALAVVSLMSSGIRIHYPLLFY